VSALPFLVEWGNVISKLVVGGVAGLGLFGYRALRNHRDVKAARADARSMCLSVVEPREGPIAVAGIYHAKGDEHWLDCSAQRVTLVGDLAIVRGSSATWKNGVRTYALRDGDGVVAIGRMTRRAGGGASGAVADYREAAGGWQLEASPGEPGIAACLVNPVPCPKPLWPVRGALVLALVGTAAYFGIAYKKSTEMPAIPGATIERWSAAVAAVCDDPKVTRKTYTDNPIASSEVVIVCTPKPEWQSDEKTGALIQLDSDGRPNRMEIQAFTSNGRAFSLARRVLTAYGIEEHLIDRVLRQPGNDRSLMTDDLRIFVDRMYGAGVVSIDVTLDNQEWDDYVKEVYPPSAKD
jgi:hypothetical protein